MIGPLCRVWTVSGPIPRRTVSVLEEEVGSRGTLNTSGAVSGTGLECGGVELRPSLT